MNSKAVKVKVSLSDQRASCLFYQPFVSSCRLYGLRATGQNIRYSGVNCELGRSKSIRYSGVCCHIFYCNSTTYFIVIHVVRCNAVFVIAILTVTSPIVINVPTRGLLAVKTKDSFVLWLAKFKYQKTCL